MTLKKQDRTRFGRGHLRRHPRGAAAVEFALVAWPVIFIIGAICEVGIFVLMQFELQYAVDSATRQVRLNTAKTWGADTFKQEVCKKIVMASNCTGVLRINVQGANTFAELKAVIPKPTDVGPTSGNTSYSDVFAPGDAGQAGAVIATYDWTFIFPFMRLFSNVNGLTQIRRLYGMSVFRHEAA